MIVGLHGRVKWYKRDVHLFQLSPWLGIKAKTMHREWKQLALAADARKWWWWHSGWLQFFAVHIRSLLRQFMVLRFLCAFPFFSTATSTVTGFHRSPHTHSLFSASNSHDSVRHGTEKRFYAFHAPRLATQFPHFVLRLRGWRWFSVFFLHWHLFFSFPLPRSSFFGVFATVITAKTALNCLPTSTQNL